MFFGQKLKERRRQSGISLFLAEKYTQVPTRYLLALEDGEFDKLPAEVYAQNFLKKYLDFLGLPFSLLEDFKKEYHQWEKRQITIYRDLPFSKNFLQKISSFFFSYNFFKKAIIIFFLFSFFAYLGVEARGIFSPPPLLISSPQDNFISNNSVIEIKGKTEKETQVAVNKKKILLDNLGNFSFKVGLRPGVNIIEVSAQKKFSQKNTVYIRVFFTKNY